MKNLTDIVIQYKETKSKSILNQIYKELNSLIQQKAKFIFYNKWFPLNLYHKCKFCRNCEEIKNIPIHEQNDICKDCEVCKCVKGFFHLKKNNLCEYEDVENDLWVEVLRIIENYNIIKDFNTYLIACLWEWMPSFLTKDYVKSLSNKSLTKIDEEGNETQIDIPDENEKQPLNLDKIYNLCKTKIERQIVDLLLEGRKQTDIAKELEVSESYISQTITRLKNKCLKLKYHN